jgi:cytochrome c556
LNGKPGLRYLVVFVLGLAIGGAMSAIAMTRINQANAYPHGVMALLHAQMGALDRSVKASRCTTNDLLPRLQTVRAVANDIEPAFVEDDERFIEHAGALRAAADAALSTPPANCAAATATLDRINETCSGCHRDFKN